jgi:hypothetical protein
VVLNLKINVEIANAGLSQEFLESLKAKVESMVQEAFFNAENKKKDCVDSDDLPVDLNFEQWNDLDNVMNFIENETKYQDALFSLGLNDEEFKELHTKVKHNLEIKAND